MRKQKRQRLVWLLLALLGACSGTASTDAVDTVDIREDVSACNIPSLYATEVVSFIPGLNAGYGQETLPDVVLGPPSQGPPSSGSLDVLSLGTDGSVVLGFSGSIQDGPGADFIVWENAFWVSGNADNVFQELGEVAVSTDGETWTVFPCDVDRTDGFDTGCAGWRPRLEYDACSMNPLVPELVGGDPYDLSELGISSVRYIRIRDRGVAGDPIKGVTPSAGFDLDAVGVVHPGL